MAIDFELLDDGIAVITINRPEKRNALDPAHFALLADAWERVRDDDAIRVAIITGAGDKAFCAGGDLKASATGKNLESDKSSIWNSRRNLMLSRGLEIWKPVIAAVNGHCLAAGMHMMMATDIRVASPNATFGLTEVLRGILATNGGTQRIMRQLPHAIAMEMVLTGQPLDAETALRYGFINRIVPLEQLLESAVASARKVAANAPLALQAAKEMLLRSRDMSLSDGIRMETFVAQFLHNTEDGKEGPRAFSEKRKPKFTGR